MNKIYKISSSDNRHQSEKHQRHKLLLVTDIVTMRRSLYDKQVKESRTA